MTAIKLKCRAIVNGARGYIEYLLIPSLAMVLPWKMTLWLFHRLAKCAWLYHDFVPEMLNQARFYDLVDDDESWIRHCKVTRMIDAADVFLCLTRTNRYLARYVNHNFDERLHQQAMIFFPHYGAGIWLYRYLAAHGVTSHLLVNPVGKSYSGYNLLCRLRLFALRFRANTRIIYPNDMLAIRHAIRRGDTLLAAPDVPAVSGVNAYHVPTELGKLNVMASFFKLAESRHLPVFSVVLGCDLATGIREYSGVFWKNLPASEVAHRFAQQTIAAVKAQSYLWHMWIARPQILFSD